jgi:2-keto-3-deoxy-6-phosphogluconate aldolase
MIVAGIVFAAGAALDAIDLGAALFSSPELQAAVVAYAGPYSAHVLKGIGVAVAIARLRSLRKGV